MLRMKNFIRRKVNVIRLQRDAPVFTLSHVVGLKGVFDSKYNYNRTDFSVRKAFWFSAFGHLNVMLQAGKVWKQSPLSHVDYTECQSFLFNPTRLLFVDESDGIHK